MAVMAITMDIRNTTAIITKGRVIITESITANAIIINAIIINDIITMGQDTIGLTGTMRHTIPATDTDCTCPSSIPISHLESAQAATVRLQVQQAIGPKTERKR